MSQNLPRALPGGRRGEQEVCPLQPFILSIADVLNDFNAWSVFFRLLLATLVGGAVGSQRGRQGRAAGLRTHILVCLGATMTAMVGLYTGYILGFSNDPLRVSAQVISGIGFLGAGTILTRNHSQVTGLTTAAGLWTTASIGLAIGIGFYWAVVVSFIIVMITISVLTRLERSTKGRDIEACYLELSDVRRVNEFCDHLGPNVSELRVLPAKSGTPSCVGLELTITDLGDASEFFRSVRELDYVVMAVPVSR